MHFNLKWEKRKCKYNTDKHKMKIGGWKMRKTLKMYMYSIKESTDYICGVFFCVPFFFVKDEEWEMKYW